MSIVRTLLGKYRINARSVIIEGSRVFRLMIIQSVGHTFTNSTCKCGKYCKIFFFFFFFFFLKKNEKKSMRMRNNSYLHDSFAFTILISIFYRDVLLTQLSKLNHTYTLRGLSCVPNERSVMYGFGTCAKRLKLFHRRTLQFGTRETFFFFFLYCTARRQKASLIRTRETHQCSSLIPIL